MLSTAPNPCRNLAVLVLRTLRVIAICARPSETLETTGGAVQNLTLTLPLGFQVVGLVKLHIGQHGGRRYRIYWMFHRYMPAEPEWVGHSTSGQV